MSLRRLIKGAAVWTEAGWLPDHDVLIDEGRIVRINQGISDPKARLIDARGWLVLPGLVDLHAHFPGTDEDEDDLETLSSGLMAAAWGGFTRVVVMPDTRPSLDRNAQVRHIHYRSEEIAGARAHVCAALTKEQAGEALTELAALRAAGAVAAGDTEPLDDARLLRNALEYARMLDMPLFCQARDVRLSQGGVTHEGEVSVHLGLAGIPRAAEWIGLARDLFLAETTGGRLHVQGVSTARSVELIRQAKDRGVRVSAECSLHHLILTDEALRSYDTNAKLLPPLRPSEDVEALIEGVRTGVIDAVVSDHTPVTAEEKDVEFAYAPFGAAGLEALLPAIHTHLVLEGKITWNDVVQALCHRPRQILGLDHVDPMEGALCEITLFNPNADDVIDPSTWRSAAKNTPLAGQPVKGRVEGVYVAGRALGRWAEEETA